MLLLFFLPSTVFHLKCHMPAPKTLHLTILNATPWQVKWLAFTLQSPGVSVKNPEVWDSEVKGRMISPEQTDNTFEANE